MYNACYLTFSMLILAVLLQDLAIPRAMDKSMILWFQHKKALKEGRSQSAHESRDVAELSVNTGSPAVLKELNEESRKRKRVTGRVELGPSKKKHLLVVNS